MAPGLGEEHRLAGRQAREQVGTVCSEKGMMVPARRGSQEGPPYYFGGARRRSQKERSLRALRPTRSRTSERRQRRHSRGPEQTQKGRLTLELPPGCRRLGTAAVQSVAMGRGWAGRVAERHGLLRVWEVMEGF